MIPAQEYSVMAISEQDAREQIMDYGIEMEISPDRPEIKLPEPEKNVTEYIDAMIARDNGDFCQGYFEDQGRYLFSDGYRIISVKNDIIDITAYPKWDLDLDIKYKFLAYVSREEWDKAENAVTIDIRSLWDKMSRNIKDIHKCTYIMQVNGVKHIVNGVYLLEALYATQSTFIRVGDRTNSPVLIGEPDGECFVFLLPCIVQTVWKLYEETPDLVVNVD